MIILLDAMGGDNAPDANIKGAVKAINQIEAEVLLIGNEEIINSRVKELYGKENISDISPKLKIHHTTETIEMCDIPTQAIKHKKDSWIQTIKRRRRRCIYISWKFRSLTYRSNFISRKNKRNR